MSRKKYLHPRPFLFLKNTYEDRTYINTSQSVYGWDRGGTILCWDFQSLAEHIKWTCLPFRGSWCGWVRSGCAEASAKWVFSRRYCPFFPYRRCTYFKCATDMFGSACITQQNSLHQAALCTCSTAVQTDVQTQWVNHCTITRLNNSHKLHWIIIWLIINHFN